MSLTTPRPVSCEYFPSCNACQLWDLGYGDQMTLKKNKLRELLATHGLGFNEAIEFISSGEFGLRDRIDFTFRYNSDTKKTDFGFYDKDKNLISVKKCLQMSAQLQKIYDEFVSIEPKTASGFISKGSVRLRNGVGGIKGCWLDLSNLDTKQLLEDRTYLKALLSRGFKLEMGQKGKAVSEVNDALKLTEPVVYPWFKTFSFSGTEIPLQCLISDFTQPSTAGAKALVNVVAGWVKQSAIGQKGLIAEFGPGIGQFTVPLLAEGFHVAALEVNEAACDNLKINSAGFNQSLLEIINADFQRRAFGNKSELVLVNPARSGLRSFTDSIQSSGAGYLIYISCFPESMCEDLAKLKTFYEIKEVKIVDQFPQTNHFETCVLLQKIK